MDSSFVLFVGFIMILLFMDCSSADSRVKNEERKLIDSVLLQLFKGLVLFNCRFWI